MSSDMVITTNLERVAKAHERVAATSERTQEIIALLRAGGIANDVKHNELHNLKVECFAVFGIAWLLTILTIPHDKKRFRLKSDNAPKPTEIELRENIEALKIVSKGRYDASPFEGFLSAYHNNSYHEPPTVHWTTEQWRNAIPTWDIASDALIRGAEIAAIVCGTLGIPWRKPWEQSDVVQKYRCAHRNEKFPAALVSDFYARGGGEKLAALYDDGIPFEDIFGR